VSNKPIRVCAVEAHPIVREGLEKAFGERADFQLAEVCSLPGNAGEMLERCQPELVLIDPDTGIRETLQLLGTINANYPRMKSVVWDQRLASAERRMLLGMGASRLLPRNLGVDEMLNELQELASSIGEETETSVAPRGADRLTPREIEVAKLVASGFKNREIAEQMGITAGTVKVHLMHVFEKTGLRDRSEIASYCAQLLRSAGGGQSEATSA
jgi:DNA-binding NarL/FixJ family response regulator